ncbi:type IX secretion system PorP/SprF family membrane protein [Aquimarina sp. MAR_2010_214]|uniref:PorP/SprF family type IX secretion system membrane protein n=1 Tax=Aquimarina sp. MAR_2010_214 TaxID=1250026 RepID=UPI000C6FD93A|nr:type IX secretion system membrane protein PorP/SprF [Aquimarina sp. MAR_2010_214]PKV52118.1 type IX secretion system PorP/SprF family membrane protein [Aquimarina sp. MAR_2010_214]
MGIAKNKIGVLLILCISAIGYTQQLPQFTQYMFNTISINPAYAGSRETLSIVGLHRSQWTGIQGGPETQTLSAHSPLRNEKIGVGLSVIRDTPGFENYLYIYGDFSYSINITDNSKLAFGFKAGATNYNLDQEFLNDPEVTEDPFFGNYANRWNPNIGAGLYLHSDKWYLGLSSPRILNTDNNRTAETSTVEYVALERVSYYLTGGYVFDLTTNTKLKPSALFKATNGAPVSVDLNANFLFYEKFWLGGSYRYNEYTASIGALADFQVTKQIRIGYAYEHFISDIRPYIGGTHEFLLMYELFNEKRVRSPRYF